MTAAFTTSFALTAVYAAVATAALQLVYVLTAVCKGFQVKLASPQVVFQASFSNFELPNHM